MCFGVRELGALPMEVFWEYQNGRRSPVDPEFAGGMLQEELKVVLGGDIV